MSRDSVPRLAIVTPDGLGTLALVKRLREALGVVPAAGAAVVLRDRSRAQPIDQRAVAELCAEHQAPLFVHCSLGLSHAWGVHFSDTRTSPAAIAALRAAEPTRLISASSHDSEAAATAALNADIVFLGPIWPTIGKPDGLGCEALADARRRWTGRRGRLFGIGGIGTAERVRQARAAGADGVAGIRAFSGATLENLWQASKR